MQKDLNQKTKLGNLEINANAQKGEVWITGFSDSTNLKKIFKNLTEWLSIYYQNPKKETKFHFRITCISKTFDKCIFDLLATIKNEYSDISENEFYWHSFYEDDDEIQDCGLEYKNLLDIPIQFIVEDEDEFNQKELDFVNKMVFENKLDKAFNLYSAYLRNNYNKWKIPIAKKIYEDTRQIKTPVVFTACHADMMLLADIENAQSEKGSFSIYMIHFIKDTSDLRTNKERFNFFTNARINTIDAIDDVLTESLNIDVKIIVVSDGSGDNFLVQNKRDINTDIFTYCNIDGFDLTKILSQNQLGDVQESFHHFAVNLASCLAMESEEISSTLSLSNSFDIMDLAPESFGAFLQGMRSIYIRNYSIDEVFSMSFNIAFVSENKSNVFEMAVQLQNMVFQGTKEEFEDVEVKKFNFSDAENLYSLTNFLTVSTNNILIIENIEQELKAEKNQIAGPTKAELIEELCNYLENNSNNILILSATKNGWENLINQYPLLRVCFQHIFNFRNYDAEVLKKRFITDLCLSDLVAEDNAIGLVEEYFNYLEHTIDPGLFNSTISTMLAREVRYYQTLRVGDDKTDRSKVVLKEDVYNSIKDEYNISAKKNLSDIMDDLDKLTGLFKVKTNIKDLAALVKIQNLRKDKNESVSLNSIFLGNPGTGKTTVAQILGEIYKDIGVLSKGHVVSVKRHDIVEQWIGYTARNMKQLIDRARGGILFIDEAYALYRPDNDKDFGIEAIDTLVAELEYLKDTTCVILAGYPNKMKEFLDSNPGLSSRFPNITEFEDYSALELNEILCNFITRANYKLAEEAGDLISNFMNKIVNEKDKYFGNARECRNIFEKLKLIHASRIVYKEQTEDYDLNTFIVEDVQKLIQTYKTKNKDKEGRVMIGFRNA